MLKCYIAFLKQNSVCDSYVEKSHVKGDSIYGVDIAVFNTANCKRKNYLSKLDKSYHRRTSSRVYVKCYLWME